MHIFLDTDDPNAAATVANHLSSKYSNTTISKGIKDAALSPSASQLKNMAYIYYGTDIFGHLPPEQARLAQYAFATEGAVLFSDKPRADLFSPIFAGSLTTGVSERILVHLSYAKSRADEIKEYPVKFFGVTQQDPKNILVIDNKSAEKNLPLITSVLEYAPDNWWHNIAFVSTANAENFREFFNDTMPYSMPVAMTKAAVAKLKSVEVEYLDASDIELTTARGGRLLRELTRRANEVQQ